MNFLPQLMTFLTGEVRYRPEFEWSSKFWTYNVFRFYELIFWRKFGIRQESMAEVLQDENNFEIKYKFFSLEALLTHLEHLIRNIKLRELVKVEITQLQFATSFQSFGLPMISFAVIFDASALGTESVTSWTHVVTGSNPGIHIMVQDRNSSTTVAAYAGATATAITSISGPVGFWTIYGWWKAACATGSNSVAITTASTAYKGASTSYSGVSVGAIDSSGSHGVSGVGTNTISTTVIAANCWLIAAGGQSSGGSAGITSNKTDRQTSTFFGSVYAFAISDSNAIVATGSQSIIYTPTGTSIQDSAGYAASIAPFVAIASTKNTSFLTLLGVG